MRGMPTADFPGIRRPSIDFQDVRDGRRSTPFYVDVDLSTARTIAAGTQLVLPIAGNSFYCDPTVDASGNPIGGVAIVHFQDTALNPQGTPFTVAPQFIANVPFTQVLIENPAQTGKRLRIVYGVDIDFRPGINAQVSISGIVAVGDNGYQPGVYYSDNTPLGVGGVATILAAGSNVNGAVVYDARMMITHAGGAWGSFMIANTAAPGGINVGRALVSNIFNAADGAAMKRSGFLARPHRLPTAYGIYVYAAVAETDGFHQAAYTIF